MKLRFWDQPYRLDKMTLKELWTAYFLHPSIQVYILAGAGCAYASWRLADTIRPVVLAAVLVVAAYPFVEYLLHRYVLHGRMYRWPWLAKAWKRVHFDHHRDPHDLRVLFGALYTTIPAITVITGAIGAIAGGLAGATAGMAAGFVVFCIYEFVHSVQHLPYQPRNRFLKKMKQLHLQHHFQDDHTNFGITNPLGDFVFGTHNPDPKNTRRSPTVFNLGYTGEEVARFPWVARLTPDLDEVQAAREGVGRKKPGGAKRA
ncbi:Sterol desaturase/sphingolipid hydroxylase, fatty acid hydroxylase superfamily [Limimonas halophila]|uniref:Sterol desaturase/sphingolipid hydroxylase, fatty acid hydroxylase superfamily n=1 Tax=Limimonas halophila TaxID=1082479 RepID=A0A1G7PQ93_9PROT|nr:sterol desaturase family protein [Limimonas halophila]SDF88457.1 Sterol desaturase/sphingolipid hydroxylase, fatty acid hydroxylase superfamily [Limimonas halophila]